MAYVDANLVRETATTTGTGPHTLLGAPTGYRTFGAKMANGDTTAYTVRAVDGSGNPTGSWERWLGTWGTGGILTNGTLRDSSTGSVISWPAGTKQIIMGWGAEDGMAARNGSVPLQDLGSVSGTVNLDLTLARAFKMSLTGNVTLTNSGAQISTLEECVDLQIQSNGYAVTFPTAWKPLNGTAPNLSPTGKTLLRASSFDAVNFALSVELAAYDVSTSLPLDYILSQGLTSPLAVSTRLLRTSYVGPLLQVTRSSDSTTQDIYPVSTADGNGNKFLDTAALAAFVGSSTGNVNKWYDQAGSGRTVTMTASGAPYVMTGSTLQTLNSKPALNGVSGYLNLSAAMPTSWDGCVVGAPQASGFRALLWLSNQYPLVLSNVDTFISAYDSTFRNSTQTWTSGEVAVVYANGQSGVMAFSKNNNTVVSTTSGGTVSRAFTSIGSNASGGQYFGAYAEMIFTDQNMTSTQISAVTRNQGVAYGVTVA